MRIGIGQGLEHLSGLTRLLAICAILGLVFCGPAQAQTTEEQKTATGQPAEAPVDSGEKPGQTPPLAPTGSTVGSSTGLSKAETAQGAAKTTKSISITPTSPNSLDYEAWERLATRAEAALAEPGTSNQGLELLRSQLVDWRSALQVAQSTNSTRIATLRTQIAALGPVPEDGTAEAEEIALRRKALTDQLVRLQAPGIAAEEAYTRADGMIREIDRTLRERQADELLKLWPSPLYPANWGLAVKGITTSSLQLFDETRAVMTGPRAGRNLWDNLPLIAVLLGAAFVLLWRGRRWLDGIVFRLAAMGPERGRPIWNLLASLGQILVPWLGLRALSGALKLSGLLGAEGKAIADFLPTMGFIVLTAVWLSWQVFPQKETDISVKLLRLPPERRAEGRFLCLVMAVVVALENLRELVFPASEVGESATALLMFPLLVVSGISLFRMGSLLRRHVRGDTAAGEAVSYRNRLIKLVAQAISVIGVVGPVLAGIGYVSAAGAMVHPAAVSLGLMGLLLVAQQAVNDLYRLVFGEEDQRKWALLPVLISFALTLAALPVLALIWGARSEDLTELWTKFHEGFQMGDTRISPTDFLSFAVLFSIGYMLTRLFQGALKSTILPKTGLDTGGQNAIVSGTGYIGIFLAGVISINAVGIDLSGLAIVAGALSVGIGFGLQNIVSNFVSGIILLIERPVSEGDWIEVGTVSGTVRAISVRSTRIQTFDRSDVIVPNADLVQQRVTNWTRYSMSGRLIVPVNVVHGSDAEKVARILQEIAEAQPLAVLNPPPTVPLMGFTMDAIQFEIRVILRDVNFQMKVRSDINHAILQRFGHEGIVLAHTPPNVNAVPPLVPGAAPRQMPLAAGPEAIVPPAERSKPEEPTL